MITNENYICLSLELHLFFGRIMKEHSFFLEAGFMGKDEEFKKVARKFQAEFGDVLYKAIDLANGNISEEVLMAEEIVTKNTLEAENITEKASGLNIDQNITKKELNLVGKNMRFRNHIEPAVNELNKHTLMLLEKIIKFKTEVLNRVLECKMFTINYPLLLKHMLREAEMYQESLLKLQRKEELTLYEQEVFWNLQMMEHAEFIRGLLDPSEEKLILTADKHAMEYKKIIESTKNNPNLTSASLNETLSFKQFKEAGEDGILSCKIKSIIVPILADHLLREANHFIRVMKENNQKEPRF